MSEAIILYRGRGGGVSEEDKRPRVYTNNGTFVAPFTGNYLVSCVGGGGGGGGGCRNSWNSSQVFYGAGGSRGGLSSGNVYLNQGDKVVMTMGSGGSAGTNNTTVVSNNSRGTNGSAGSTTTFGSYKSGSGGIQGGYSWHYHYWSNIPTNTTIQAWDWLRFSYQGVPGGISPSYINCWLCDFRTYVGGSWSWNCSNCGVSINMQIDSHSYVSVNMSNIPSQFSDRAYSYATSISNSVTGYKKTITQTTWSNKIQNVTTRCYTSIQQGTWWYLNNNTVSTAGTRAYSGDGGQSGRAGNSGFILIYPQWSE